MKLFKKVNSSVPDESLEGRAYIAEALEARILYSGAPVSIDGPDASVDEVPAVNDQGGESGFQSLEGFSADIPYSDAESFEQSVTLTSWNNLTEDEIEDLAQVAIENWTTTGLNEAQLAALEIVEFSVVDLDGGALGYAEGSHIYIDSDAAGSGWFLDSTPSGNEEFFIDADGNLKASTGIAGEGFDLLSVLQHEIGHVLGLEDIYESIGRTDVMYGLFEEGERRTLVMGQAEGAKALSLEGAHFAATRDAMGEWENAETWTGGGGDNNWTNGANWADGTAPSEGIPYRTIVFEGSNTAVYLNQAGGSGGRNANSFVFDETAGAFTVSGYSFDMLGSGTDDDSAEIINLSSETQTIESTLIHRPDFTTDLTFHASAGDIIISGDITKLTSQVEPVVVKGTHNVTFSGTNDYIGPTVIGETITDDFQSYIAQNLNTDPTGGIWEENGTATARIENDGGNHFLGFGWEGGDGSATSRGAYREIPAVGEGGAGVVSFDARIDTDAAAGIWSYGVTDTDTPNTQNGPVGAAMRLGVSFVAGAPNDSKMSLVAGEETLAGNLNINQWYSIDLVIDHSNDTYNVYLDGVLQNETPLAFDSPTNEALDRFVVVGGGGGTQAQGRFAGHLDNLASSAGSTLFFNGSHTGGGAYIVNSASFLGGTGGTESELQVAGTLSPGAVGAIGEMESGGISFSQGATFEVQIDGDGSMVPGSGNDVVNVDGDVFLGEGLATLDVSSLGSVPAGAHSFILINNTSGSTTGYFKDSSGGDLSEGAVVTVDGRGYTISYVGGDGNDVVLNYGSVLYVNANFVTESIELDSENFASDPAVTKEGAWFSSTTSSGYLGDNYLAVSNDDTTGNTVAFTPELQGGLYEVSMRWTASGNRATNTPVTIVDGYGDTHVVNVDQTQNNNAYVSLGQYYFVPGESGSVTISNENADNYVIADGVRFDQISGLAADADDELAGDQPGQVFQSINGALAVAETNEPLTLVINKGDYSTESVDLSGFSDTVTLKFIEGDSRVLSLLAESNVVIELGGVDGSHNNSTTLTLESGDISGVISGSGGITKEGSSSSSLLELSGDNTYSGTTTVNRGILRIAHSNALGDTGAGSKTIVNGADSASGARIQIRTSTPLTISEAIDFNANASGRASLDVSSSGTHTFTGPIDVSSNTNIVQFFSSGSGALKIEGDITGTMSGSQLYVRGNSTNLENHIAGNVNLTGHRLSKTDNGTWTVGAAGETYNWDNGTLIAVGTLRMGVSNVITTGTVYLGQNTSLDATWDLNNTDQSATFIDMRFDDTSAPVEPTGHGTIETGTGTLTLNGNLLYRGTAGLVNETSFINGNLDLNSMNRTFTVNDGGQDIDLQINAKVTNGTLTKAGAGNLVIGGSENNTDLSVTVNAGTLTLAKTSSGTIHSIDSTGTALTVNSGGTLVVAGSGGDQIVDTADVTVEGQLNITVAETIDGLNGSGGVDIAAGVVLTVGGGDDATADFTGTIAGDGAIAKIGTGTQTLSGANTYGGDTTISSGVLKLGNYSALGDEVGKTVINGGTLDIAGFRAGASGNELVEVQGTGAGGIGAINNSGGTQTGAFRRIVLTGDTTFRADNRWDMRNSGGASSFDMGGFTLTKVGTREVALVNTTISNHGSVDVNQGIFRLEGNTDFDGTGTISVASGAILDFWSSNQTHEVNIDLAGGALLTSSSAATYSTTLNGTVTLNGVASIGANQGNPTNQRDLVISGDIQGSGGINKIGVKSVTLSGTNTYQGTTVINSGSLFLNGTHTGGGDYSVSSGAIFGGTGTTDAKVVVDDGGELSPGVSGIGSLIIHDNTTINGVYNFQIDGTNAIPAADLLDVTGTVTLGATAVLTLEETTAGSVTAGETITLVNNDDVDEVSGTFSGLAEGATVTDDDGDNYIISYAGGDGNDIVLFAIGAAGAAETEVSFDSGTGVLTITDINGYDSADNLTITYDQANDEYVISDASLILTTSGLTGTDMSRPDAQTVRVSGAGVTAIVFDTGDNGGGTDTLTVDIATGIPNPTGGISFAAGDGTDELVLIDSSGSFGAIDSVAHNFVSGSEGSITLGEGSTSSTITYTGLEGPITDTIDADDRLFTFAGDAETITLSDAATGGALQIDSSLGALVEFTNPNDLLSINTTTGTGIDSVTITGLDSGFSANLTVVGDGDDVLNVTGPIDTNGGNINVTTQNIEITGSVDVGGGNITLNANSSATRGIYVGASLTTDYGTIRLDGDGGGAGNQGVLIEADITSNTGDISITGSSDADDGVAISGATVSSTNEGNVTISGSGGDNSTTFAVDVDSTSQVSTVFGSIDVVASGSARIGGNFDAGNHPLRFDSSEDLHLIDGTFVGGLVELEADNDVDMTSGVTISGPLAGSGDIVLLSQNFQSFPVNSSSLIDGWRNDYLTQESLDFVSDRGGTPSSGTGPSADHTLGDSSGTFLFLEASGAVADGEYAHLFSPEIDLTGQTNSHVEFYYHMYSSDNSMGDLVVEVTVDGGGTWTELLSVSGDQGNQWNQADLDLSSFDGQPAVQLRITGVRGSDYRGDIALDDFRFYADSGDLLVEDFETFGQGPNTNPRPEQVLPVASGWTNQVSAIEWNTIRGGTPSGSTGASSDTTLGNGNGTYLFIETSDPVLEDQTARLVSPSIDLSSQSTARVEFNYHMWGAHMGDMKVQGSGDGGTTWTDLLTVSGNQGNQWNLASINLDAFVGSTDFVLRVDGIAGPVSGAGSAGYMSDISLDDFRFYGEPIANSHVIVTADADGDSNGSGGSITMADGAEINAVDGNVTLRADEDITVGSVSTTATVSATSTSGAILDGGDSGVDITAGAFIANGAAGVGTLANSLDTALNNIEADGNTGGVYVSNTGNLTIGEAGAGFGVTVKEGATVSISTTNDLTVAANTVVQGTNVDLSADNDVDLLTGAQILGPSQVTILQEDFESFTEGSEAAGATNIALGNGWVNIQGTDQIDWSPDAGATPSGGTGPASDHTTGNSSGKFLYIETSDSVLEGWTAELHTPEMDLSGVSSASLEFYYHMYAQIDRGAGATDMGTLKVYGSTDGGTNWTEIFTETENQGNQWNQATVNLDAFAGNSSFILRVDGIAGAVSGAGSAGYQSDIAIDDFTITAVPVNGTVNVTITADANGDATGTGGAIDMADSSSIVAGAGTVALNADGNITVSSVSTTGDATVTSGNGEILDRANTPDIAGGTVTFNGNVAPGLSAPGTLQVEGNLDLADDDVLTLDIDGTTPDSEHDQVAVIGTVSLDDTLLDLDFGSIPADGSSYVIVDNDGTDAVTGIFQINDEARGLVDLPEGSAFTASGKVFTITYEGGTDANDIVLTVVGDAETEVLIDASGNLVVNDINGESSDSIEILVQNIDGTDYYVIRDINSTPLTLTTSIGAADANRISASEIHVRVAAVSGGLDVNTANPTEAGASDTVTLSSDLTFAGPIEINAEAINLSTSVKLDAPTLTLNGSVNLGANILTVDVSTGTSSINGAIVGTGDLVKQGAGRLDLAGSSGNTYTGTTAVSGGRLHLNNTGGNAIGGNLDITTGGQVTFGRSHQIIDTADVTMSDAGSVFNGTGPNAGSLGVTETFASLTVTGGAFNTNSSGSFTITGAGSFTGGAGNTMMVGNSGTRLLSFGSLELVDMTATTGLVANSFTLYGNSSGRVSTMEIGAGGLTLNNSNLNLRRGSAGSLGSRLILDGDVTTLGTSSSTIREDTSGGTSGLAEIQLNGAHNFNVGGSGADLTISTGIADATNPGELTKTGAGELTLSGRFGNTATGVTTVSSGILHLDKSSGDAVAGDLAIAGGKVTFGGDHQIGDTSAVSLSGAGSVLNGTGANAGNEPVTETMASLTVDGGVFNTGFGSVWTVTGAGSFTGGAGNTAFLGNSGSTIAFDSLSLVDMSAIANPLGRANSFAVYGNGSTVQTTVTVGSGGLTLENSQLSMKRGGGGALGSRLVLDGDVTVNGTATSLITNDTSSGSTGTVEVEFSSTAAAATRDFNIAAGAGLTINIEVNDGASAAGSLSKSGDGVLTLNVDNTYQGTTDVNGGTLLVNGTHSGGAGYTVTATATLGGTGATTSTVTATGGTVSPGLATGADTIDDLATGDLTLSGAATTFLVEIEGATAGTLHDQIDVTGTVDLGGSTLQVTVLGGFNPAADDEFVIIDNDAADGVTGTFDGLPEGATVTATGGEKFTITYVGGDGNDVVLFAGVAETNVDFSGGVLTISDINSENADGISFTYDSSANEYVITDPNLVLSTTGLDSTQVIRPDAHTVRVDAALVTGGVVIQTSNTGLGDAADTVTIGGTEPIVFPGTLSVEAETIDFAGDISMGGDSSLTGTNASFNGNTILGPNTLTLDLSGAATNSATSTFDFSSGTITFANGTELVNEGIFVNSDGNTNTILNGTGTFTNNGTVNHSASGSADNMELEGAVTFNNAGTYEFINNGDIRLQHSGAVFNNSGLLLRSGATGDASYVFDSLGTFNNLAGGEVRATAGRLRVDTGGTSDATAQWNAVGGDIGLGSGTSSTAAAWTGTFAGTATGSSHIEITNPNNGVIGNGNFVIGTGGVTFDISGNGVEWNNTEIISQGNALSNAGNLRVIGTGTNSVTGGGTVTNTATGDIDFENGTLTLSGDLTNNGTIDIETANGKTLNGGGDIINANGATINQTDGGALTIDGGSEIIGHSGSTLNLNDGSLVLTNGGVTSAGTTNVNDSDYSISGSGTFANASGGTVNLTTGTVTVDGATFTNQSGGTVDFAGANLTLANSASVNNEAGGDFDLTGGVFTINIDGTSTLTNAGSTTWAAGADGNKTITGSGSFVNDGTFNHNRTGGADNLILNGSVTFENNGTFDFNHQGDINMESNSTFVNNGLLTKTGNGSDPSFIFTFGTTDGNFVQGATGTVQSDVGELRIAVENLTSDPAGTWNANGGDIELAGTVSGTITGTASGAGAIRIENEGNSAILDDVTVGAGGLVFDVSGNGVVWTDRTIDTAGNNLTNAGVLNIVSAGTKNLQGSGQLITANGGVTTIASGATVSTPGTANMLIENGGTVAGGGTFDGEVTGLAGSTVAPGGASDATQTLSTGDIDFGGGNFTIDLDGVTNGDLLDVTGTVNLNSAVLNVNSVNGIVQGSAIVIIENDGSDAVTGTFAGLPEGATVTAGGQDFIVSYAYDANGDGNANDVVLFAGTPETSVSLGVDGVLSITDIGTDPNATLQITYNEVDHTYTITGTTESGNDLVIGTDGFGPGEVQRPDAYTVVINVEMPGGVQVDGINVDTAGDVTVSAAATHEIALSDSLSITADNIEFTSGTEIISNGNITLNAGDNLILNQNASLTSDTGAIAINVDQAGAGNVAGSIVSLLGEVDAGPGQVVTITGGDNVDVFNIVPSTDSIIRVNGGDPTHPVTEGDVLNIIDGINPLRTVTGQGEGFYSFGGGQQNVEYVDIERDNIPTIEIDIPISQRLLPTTLNGEFTDFGLDDSHTLTVDWKNGVSTFAIPSFTSGLSAGDVIPSSTDGAQLTITAADPATGKVEFTVTHTYAQDGLYDVEVTVVDSTLAQAEANQVAEVYFLAPSGGNGGFFSSASLPGRFTLSGFAGLFNDLRLERLFATDESGRDVNPLTIGEIAPAEIFFSLDGEVRVVYLTGVEHEENDLLDALNNSILHGTPLDLSGNVLPVDSTEVLKFVSELIKIDVDGVE